MSGYHYFITFTGNHSQNHSVLRGLTSRVWIGFLAAACFARLGKKKIVFGWFAGFLNFRAVKDFYC